MLSLEELRRVWDAAGELGAFGAIVRLLILTGQRRDEIAELEWREVDLAAAMISLPGARTKNGKPHVVPLARQAVAILEALEHRHGDRVFAAQTWDQIEGQARRDGAAREPWVLHDLRRSAVTRMAELGIAPHVVEAVVNHVSGHKAGVAGVYNKATYAAEKRAALQRWADHLLEVESATSCRCGDERRRHWRGLAGMPQDGDRCQLPGRRVRRTEIEAELLTEAGQARPGRDDAARPAPRPWRMKSGSRSGSGAMGASCRR